MPKFVCNGLCRRRDGTVQGFNCSLYKMGGEGNVVMHVTSFSKPKNYAAFAATNNCGQSWVRPFKERDSGYLWAVCAIEN